MCFEHRRYSRRRSTGESPNSAATLSSEPPDYDYVVHTHSLVDDDNDDSLTDNDDVVTNDDNPVVDNSDVIVDDYFLGTDNELTGCVKARQISAEDRKLAALGSVRRHPGLRSWRSRFVASRSRTTPLSTVAKL
jgi:hypothetical protein